MKAERGVMQTNSKNNKNYEQTIRSWKEAWNGLCCTALRRNHPCWQFDLVILAPRTLETMNFCYWSHPVSGTLLWQSSQPNTGPHTSKPTMCFFRWCTLKSCATERTEWLSSLWRKMVLVTVSLFCMGRGEEGKERKQGNSHQGPCIKDPRTKTIGWGRIECGRWRWVGWRRVMEGGWGMGTTVTEQQ